MKNFVVAMLIACLCCLFLPAAKACDPATVAAPVAVQSLGTPAVVCPAPVAVNSLGVQSLAVNPLAVSQFSNSYQSVGVQSLGVPLGMPAYSQGVTLNSLAAPLAVQPLLVNPYSQFGINSVSTFNTLGVANPVLLNTGHHHVRSVNVNRLNSGHQRAGLLNRSGGGLFGGGLLGGRLGNSSFSKTVNIQRTRSR